MKPKRWIITLLLILLTGIFPPGMTLAAPNALNYQGSLTDSGGVPVPDQAYNMVFRIYDAATGGTLLYEESQTVTTVKGIYNALLGTGTASVGTFDPALFSADNRWLEVEVNAEILTPRQQVTSVAFALQAAEATHAAAADDADTVDGMHAVDLDQSAHMTDTGNPHNVTAAQTGAATPGDIATHAANASAHHTKTTSFTELTGTAADAQIPATIARDSEIMTTVLSGDGTGSGLDADKLDGQDSIAFAAALHNHDSAYINVTGDTMTGALFLPPNGLVAGTNQLILSGGYVGIGTSSPSAQLHVDGAAGALFTGTYGSGTIPLQGAGTRLMWYPGKAAFRAGKVTGTEWDDSSVGDYSISAGVDTIAWGYGSTAFGDSAKAYGHQSTAIGQNAQASGTGSTALGVNTLSVGSYSTVFGAGTRADGEYSMAMGQDTTAETYNEIVMGRFNTLVNPTTSSQFNWNAADRLLVIGNGTSVTSRSDAMIILKNGNTGIGTVGGSAPSARLHVANPIIDNTSGKHTLYLTESNNAESPTSGLDPSKPYYGIGFRRAWNTNDMSNIKNIAGIYAYGVQGYRGTEAVWYSRPKMPSPRIIRTRLPW